MLGINWLALAFTTGDEVQTRWYVVRLGAFLRSSSPSSTKTVRGAGRDEMAGYTRRAWLTLPRQRISISTTPGASRLPECGHSTSARRGPRLASWPRTAWNRSGKRSGPGRPLRAVRIGRFSLPRGRFAAAHQLAADARLLRQPPRLGRPPPSLGLRRMDQPRTRAAARSAQSVVWGCGNFELAMPSRLFANRRALRSGRLQVRAWAERQKPAVQRRFDCMTRLDSRGRLRAFCGVAGGARTFTSPSTSTACAPRKPPPTGRTDCFASRTCVGR